MGAVEALLRFIWSQCTWTTNTAICKSDKGFFVSSRKYAFTYSKTVVESYQLVLIFMSH